jgi:hypothetical protein
MALAIFPISPLPANLDRTLFWSDNVNHFDSGARQAMTPYLRPLHRYEIPIQAMEETREATLVGFVNSMRGRVTPFLMKDPYDYRVNSVMGVRSGITHAATLQLFDVSSFLIRADTTTIGSLFSTLSGYVRLGVEYSYDQDTGLITVNTKTTTDVWGVRSAQYYLKCAFEEQYRERARLWNIFATNLTVWEIV